MDDASSMGMKTPASAGIAKKSPIVSKSRKAGLQFPVGRVARFLKMNRYSRRFGASTAVYLAAVVEYLVSEILELSADVAGEAKRTRITPRHIKLAIQGDEELDRFLGQVIIANGGVTPTSEALIPISPHSASMSSISPKPNATKPTEAAAEQDSDSSVDEYDV